jgi:hypothetical protein
VAWWRGRGPGWRGKGRGGWGPGWGWWRWGQQWPGRGPFADLPPWERPGWRLGPGACWRLYGVPGWLARLRGYLPWPTSSTAGSGAPQSPEEAELRLLEDIRDRLREELRSIEERIEELRRTRRSQ